MSYRIVGDLKSGTWIGAGALVVVLPACGNTPTPMPTPTPVIVVATATPIPPPATPTPTTSTLNADFTVTSPTRGANACVIQNASGALDCTFNGSRSTGPIRSYHWFWITPRGEREAESQSPILNPTTDCGFIGLPSGAAQFVQMEVRLRVRDASGSQSAPAINRDVRIFSAQNRCGF